MSELGVYAAFLKDTMYATFMVLLYVLIRSPVWWLFLLHGLTWVAFIFYYISDNSLFWPGTAAIVITLLTAATDVFVLLNTLCYLPESTCCLPGKVDAPFTLGEPVCGAGDRYDTPILTWLSVTTVGMGIFNAVWRTIGIYNTCDAASVEVGMIALYIVTKTYIMGWRGVDFSVFFWLQSCLCICQHVAGVVLAFKYGLRFVANLLFLAAILLDSLVISGVIPTIGASSSDTGKLSVGGGVVAGSTPATFTLGFTSFGASATGAVFSTGAGALPGQIRAVWYFLHSLMLLLSSLVIFGFLTRAPRTPGPFFDANKRVLDERFGEDGAEFGAPPSSQTHAGFRKRGSAVSTRIPL
jgi:hypothetical protein